MGSHDGAFLMFQVSTSKIRLYKSCRHKYFLRYIKNIQMPKTEALEVGGNYHEEVAKYLRGEFYNKTPMTSAFASLELPKIKEVEKPFEVSLGYGLGLRGVIDAITIDNTPIEHKTTKSAIDEEYIYKLNFDEQVTTYLSVLTLLRREPVTKMIYTVVQKPTIRLKQNETPEEYEARCFAWYSEPATNPKVKTFDVVRSVSEIAQYLCEVKAIAKEMQHQKLFYRNPSNCQILGCEYSHICLDYYTEIK
jgi:PD-(D/E)XK nuclease superfamily